VRKLVTSRCMSICLFLTLAATAAVAAAGDLRIGFKAEVTAADPHVLSGQNRNVWAHVYESLIAEDAQLRAQPQLALSWRAIKPTVWEFKLRPHVRFHNGETMTAEDVKYSIERAMNLTGARTFRTYLKGIKSVQVSAPLTIQVTTDVVNPTMPDNLGLIAIIPRSLGAQVNEASFAGGKAAIGTGPYKFLTWINGQKVVLARNNDYWGAQEPWDTVTFQFIPREPARAAALLSGAVDIIDGATTNLRSALRASNQMEMATTTSYMLNYLSLDQGSTISPYIQSNDGVPLKSNPLKLRLVRQALMSAISRPGLIKFLMKKDGTAAQQIVPQGFLGYDSGLTLPPYDVAKGKALLAEAGYAQGFRMTIHCPNNRYVNDARLCEALAQLFSQIGVTTEVVTMPFSVFLSQLAGGSKDGAEFSAFLIGAGAVTGDSLTILASAIHTRNPAKGLGANNYGHYSNVEVDRLIEDALQTMDPGKREALQQEATRIALQDGAMLPLLHQNASWAFRKNIHFVPRADGFTMAMNIRPNISQVPLSH